MQGHHLCITSVVVESPILHAKFQADYRTFGSEEEDFLYGIQGRNDMGRKCGAIIMNYILFRNRLVIQSQISYVASNPSMGWGNWLFIFFVFYYF